MATRLIDQVEEKEKQEVTIKRGAAKKITSGEKNKDRQISAKVNSATYDLFTKINQEQGLSNNSAINLLISRYVRENKGILVDTPHA